jgi:tetratricopeptide (TPR) repeat protein
MSVRFNARFAVISFLAVAALLAGYFVLHARQARRNAAGLIDYAERAAAEGKPDRALRALNRYLLTYPDDRTARAQYAQLLINTQPTPAGRARAVPTLERLLADEPDRDDLRAQIATLLYDAHQWAAAQPYLEARTNRPDATALDIERLGKLYAVTKKWDALAKFLTPICMGEGRGPTVFDYVRLAEAHRQLGKANESQVDEENKLADAVMDKLVADYAKTYEAYLARAEYRERYIVPGIDSDLSEARKLDSTTPKVALAVAARAAGRADWKNARDVLKAGLAANPQEAPLYRQLGAVEAASGEPKDAVAVLRTGVKRLPDDAGLALFLAEALTNAGEFEEARKQLNAAKKLPQIGVRATDADLVAARLDLEAGDWPAALRALEDLRPRLEAAKEPMAVVDALLVRCAALAGDQDRRLRYARRIAERGDPGGRAQYAGALLDAGRVDEAIAEYRVAARERRAALSTAVTLARLLVFKFGVPGTKAGADDWKEVDGLLNKVADAAPDAWEVPVLQAEALFTRRRPEEAKKHLADARGRRPKDFPLWGEEATILAREKKLPEADALLVRAEKEAGDSVDLRLTRLRLHLSADVEAADTTAQANRIALIDRTGLGIERFLPEDRERLWRAQAEGYALLGKLPEEAAAIDRVVGVRPNDLEMWLARFELAESLGDAPMSERSLEHIRRLDGAAGPCAEYAAAYHRLAPYHRLRTDDPKVPDQATLQATLQAARRHLDDVDRRRNGWGKAAQLRGDLERLAGDEDAMARAYREAFDRGEHSPAVLIILLKYYSKHQKIADAEDLMRRTLANANPDAAQSRTFAELYLQAPNYVAAYELAKKAVGDNPTDLADLIWLAQIGRSARRPAEEIEKTLWQAVNLNRTRPDGWVSLVQFLVGAGRKVEAEKVVGDVVRTVPAEHADVILPLCYDALGNETQAAESYRRALKAKPGDLGVAQAAAAFFLRTGHPEQAGPIYQPIVDGKIKDAKPQDEAAARRALALCVAARGPAYAKAAMDLLEENAKVKETDSKADAVARALVLASFRATYPDAVRLLDTEFTRQPLPAQHLFLLARLAMATGQPKKAGQAMLALLEADPENVEYLRFWVEALLRQDQISDGKFWLDKLVRVQRDSVDTVRLQALADFRSGQRSSAVSRLQSLDAKTAADVSKLSALLEEFGELDKAEAWFRRAEAMGTDPMAKSMAGLALACFLGRQGKYAEGVDICDKARAALPADLVVTVAVEVLRGGEAPPDEAVVKRVEGWLSQAEASVPPERKWQPVWLAGELADARRNPQGYLAAIEAYHRALGIAPDQPLVMASLGRELVLNPAGTPEDANEAARRLARVVDASPANPDEVEGLMALAALKSPRPEMAVERLKKVEATLPTPRGAMFLAYALNATGDAKAAEAAWQTALDRGLTRSQLHPLERPLEQTLRTAFPKVKPVFAGPS